jgi:FKBP-type peptidyl-prolyl cis-trans isomerase FkpA
MARLSGDGRTARRRSPLPPSGMIATMPLFAPPPRREPRRHWSVPMKVFKRGVAALMCVAAIATAVAQDRTTLATDRDKVSYAIGMDVGNSIKPVGPDLDFASFEKGLRNAFAGGQPALGQDEAMATDKALRARIAARDGKPVAGAAPGAPPPAVDKAKVGQLLGGFVVGPSLAQIKDEIELPVFLQAVRTVLAGGQPLLAEADAKAVLSAFSQRMQGQMQAKSAALGEKNRAEGAAFLARNRLAKGVVTTPSGLQYMVLRQGSGARPKPTDHVTVNYKGTLLDGTKFDSSYDRPQPPEPFALDQVIPGWSEGVSLMPVGAKYRFWIPSDLGYGDKGTPGGPIGPNATLVFDVELLGIQ